MTFTLFLLFQFGTFNSEPVPVMEYVKLHDCETAAAEARRRLGVGICLQQNGCGLPAGHPLNVYAFCDAHTTPKPAGEPK